MAVYKKYSFKFLSVILAIAVCVGTFVGILPGIIASSDQNHSHTVYDPNSSAGTSLQAEWATGDNVALNVGFDISNDLIYTNTDGTKSSFETGHGGVQKHANITNGKGWGDDSTRTWIVKSGFDVIFANDGVAHIDYIVDLDDASSINRIDLMSGFSSDGMSEDFAVSDYEIFVADSRNELFEGTSLVNIANNTAGSYINSVEFDTAVEGRFVGIRVWKVGLKANGTYSGFTPAVNQIAVMGEEIVVNATYTDETKFLSEANGLKDNTKNLVYGMTPVVATYDNFTVPGTPSAVQTNGDGFAGMSDGAFDTVNVIPFDGTSNLIYTESGGIASLRADGDVYTDITYTLSRNAKIKEIYVQTGSTELIRAIGRYEVYIGNDVATMLAVGPVITVDNRDVGAGKSDIQKISFAEAVTGSVVVIRVTSWVAGLTSDASSVYGRVNEIAVVGELVKTYSTDVTSFLSETNGLKDNTQNLVFGVTPEVKTYDNFTTPGTPAEVQTLGFENFNKFTNGETTDNNNVIPFDGANNIIFVNNGGTIELRDDGDIYTDIAYDLGEYAEINEIYMMTGGTELARAVGKYQVYLGEDKATAISAGPVITVDNRSGGTAKSNIQKIIFTEVMSAKTVVIRVTSWVPCVMGEADALYGRVNEIAVVGTKTNSVAVSTAVADTDGNPLTDITVTGANSYIVGATATLTAPAEKTVGSNKYTFKKWTVDGNQVSTDATYSFTVSAAVTVTAVYEISQSSVVYNAYLPENYTAYDSWKSSSNVAFEKPFGITDISYTDSTGTEVLKTDHGAVQNFSNATDGKSWTDTVSNIGSNGNMIVHSSYQMFPNDGVANIKFTLDLQVKSDIDEMVIVSGISTDGIKPEFIISDYEIHVADTKEALYTGSPVATVVASQDGAFIQSLKFNNDIKGRFVGIKVTKIGYNAGTYATTHGPSLNELVVLGTAVPSSAVTTAVADTDGNPLTDIAVTGAATYENGTTATLTAPTSKEFNGYRYTFKKWTVDGNQVSTNTTYQFTVSGATTVIAVYSKAELPVIHNTYDIPENFTGYDAWKTESNLALNKTFGVNNISYTDSTGVEVLNTVHPAVQNFSNATDGKSWEEISDNLANGNMIVHSSYQMFPNDGVSNIRFTVDLEAKSNIDEIDIMTGLSTDGIKSEYIISDYEIYTGNSLSNLYSGTPVATIKNSNNNAFVQTVKFREAVTGRYVGIKVTKIGYLDGSYQSTHGPALNEIAVLGTVIPGTEEKATYTDVETFLSEAEGLKNPDKNIAYGMAPGVTTYDNFTNPGNPIAVETKGDGFGGMSDGDVNGIVNVIPYKDGLGNIVFKDEGGTKVLRAEGEVYTDIIYSFSGTATIEELYVQTGGNEKVRAAALYEVYIGDDTAEMLAADPVITVDNRDIGAAKSNIQKITLKEPMKGSYVIIRVLAWAPTMLSDPDSVYGRVNEIAIIGEVVLSGTTNCIFTNTFLSEAEGLKDDKINIAYNNVPNITTYDNFTSPGKPIQVQTNGQNFNAFSDGNVDNGADIIPYDGKSNLIFTKSGETVTLRPDGDIYTDIVYLLGGNASIDEIYIKTGGNETPRAVGLYEVYVGDDLTEMVNKGPAITVDNRSGSNAKSNVQKLVFGEPLKGSMVLIRVLAWVPCAFGDENSLFGRVNEIAIVGKVTKSVGTSCVFTNNFLSEEDGLKNDIKNLVYNKLAVVTTYDNFTTPGKPIQVQTNSDGFKGMSDGDVDSGAQIIPYDGKNNLMFTVEGKKATLRPDGDIYTDIVYYLSGASKIDEIYIKTGGTEPFRAIGLYEVYVGDDTETILENGPAITVDNRSGGTGKSNVQKITFGESLEGSVVLIRVLAWVPTMLDDYSSVYGRVNEIAVVGQPIATATTEVKDLDTFLTEENGLTDASVNVAFGKTPTINSYDNFTNPGAPMLVGTNDPATFKNASDGKLDAFATVIPCDSESNNLIYTKNGGNIALRADGEVYTDIIYSLGEATPLNSIYVYTGTDLANAVGKYEVYAGYAVETLFDEDPIAVVDNRSKDGGAKSNIQRIDITSTLKVPYIAIRVLSWMASVPKNETDIYGRLVEVAIVEGEPVPTGPASVYFVEEYLEESIWHDKEQNVVLERNPTIMSYETFRSGTATPITSNGADPSKLVDGLEDGSCIIPFESPSTNLMFTLDGDIPTLREDGAVYTDMIFSFAEETKLDYMYIWTGGTELMRSIGRYQIFVSKTKSKLFSEDPVIDVDNRQSGSAISKIQKIKFNSENMDVSASYVGIRVLAWVPGVYGNHSDLYGRIMEVSIVKVPDPVEPLGPTNLAEHMPIEAYLTDGDGNQTKIGLDNLSAKEIASLTNGSLEDTVSIWTGGKKLDIYYNLCSDMYIDDILISSIAKSSDYLGEFKVYASLVNKEVWEESSLVYHYVPKGASKQTAGISFDSNNRLHARYIRISFMPSNRDIMRLSEIQIIGLNNQKLKYKNVSRTTEPQMSAYTSFINENRTRGLTLSEDQMLTWLDGDKYATAAVQAGKSDNESINLIVKLNDLKTASSIDMYFAKRAFGYWPTKMNVYIGTTSEDVENVDAEPVVEWEGKLKNGNLNVEFAPMLARYIRFEIVADDPKYELYEDMCIAICDLMVMGTDVKGLQNSEEDDALLTFTDAKSGIRAEIVRFDRNDIFTDVATMKVITSTVTNWQKTSLNKAPFFKVVNDKAYEIQFLDVRGNEVTDLEGREVRISFPLNGDDASSFAIGNAMDRERIVMVQTEPSADGSRIQTVFGDTGIKVSLLALTTGDDKYWTTIGPLEDFSEEEEEKEDNIGSDVEVDIISPDTGEKLPVVWIVLIVAAAIALVTASTIKTKKHKER